jgi:dienelactone hydrolase
MNLVTRRRYRATPTIDDAVRLVTLRERPRHPYRAPVPPYDSPGVFEELGLTTDVVPRVDLGTPVEVGSYSVTRFSFTSRTTLEWPECNTAHGELFRCNDDEPRPVAVLVHGNNARSTRLETARAKRLLARGVHVARICFAGHLQRIPAGERTGEHTVSPDLHGSVSTFVQAAGDVADLVRWLHRQPFVTRIGLAGWSAGGMTVMLAATLVEVDALVPVVPASDSGWILSASRYIPAPVRAAIAAGAGDTERVRMLMRAIRPTERKPLGSPRIVVLAGAKDELCGTARTGEIAAAWPDAEIRWLPYGHIAGALIGSRKGVDELADILTRPRVG